MVNRIAVLVLGSVAFAGCDAANEIAGEAIEGEVRNAVAAQCEQVSESARIAADRIAEVCRCTADTFMADSDLTLDDVSRENIEAIVNTCAGVDSEEGVEQTETTPTENVSG